MSRYVPLLLKIAQLVVESPAFAISYSDPQAIHRGAESSSLQVFTAITILSKRLLGKQCTNAHHETATIWSWHAHKE